MEPDEAWIAQALEAVVSRCPRSSWELEPVRDYHAQRLSVYTMHSQLTDWAAAASPRLQSALAQWATTGRWPGLKRFDGAYLWHVMSWVQERYGVSAQRGSRKVRWPGPSPTAATTVALVERVWSAWYRDELDRWATEVAEEEFARQEQRRDSADPLY